MSKSMRRILIALACSFFLIVGAGLVHMLDVYAASIVDSGTLDDGKVSWTLDSNGTLTVSGTGRIIKGSGTSSPWSDSNANYTNKTIVNVIIEDGITAIGRGAFDRCLNLESATIPTTVTEIDTYAFHGCTSLHEITIPNSVKKVGQYVFKNCSNLSSITLSNRLDKVGMEMFYGCSSLTGISIPSSVKNIYSSAFYGCSRLSEITIPNGVTEIYESTFEQCSSLQRISVPSGVTTINNYAFRGCSGLTSIEIEGSLSTIGDEVFADCTGLTSITVPNCKMGEGVFSRCTGLRSISIPSDVLEIPANTFYQCTGLKDITIPETISTIGAYAFSNCTNLTDIRIYGRPSIREYVFKGCTGLTSVTMPLNVVGAGVFSNCTGLVNVIIPEGIDSIGYEAFSGCTSIKEILVPSGVEEIENYAFRDCKSLSSISIPNTVIKIGDSSFSNCSNLIVICEDGSYTLSYVAEKGIKYDLTTGHTLGSYTIVKNPNCTENGEKTATCITCKKEVSEQIPALGHNWSDRYIIDKAATCTQEGRKSRHCANCDVVADITVIPATGHAFAKEFTIDIEPTYTEEGSKSRHCANCDEVTDVTVIPMLERISIEGATVSEIGDKIYTGDYVWADVTVTLNGEVLEKNADYQCWYNNNIEVGEATVSIEGINKYEGSIIRHFQIVPYAGSEGGNVTWSLNDGVLTFSGSGAIMDYTNGGSNFTPWRDKYGIRKVVIEDGITRIGDWLFYRLQGLEEVVIPDSVVSIGEGAFYLSSRLTKINLPDSVTTIGERAFDHTGIESFTLPPKVTEIPNMLFYYGKLKSIKLHSGVKSIGSYAFGYCPLQSITLPGSIVSIAENSFYNCTNLDCIYVVKNSYADNWAGDTYNKVYVYKSGDHYIYKESITKEATCLDSGEVTKYCSLCGDRITEAIPSLGGHKWNKEYTVDKKATYAAKGSKSIHCKVCDEIDPESVISIPKMTVKTTSISKVTPAKKGFTVKWQKGADVTGYEIQCALNSNFTKSKKTVKITKAGTTSKKITKLKAKKKYYVRIRAYRIYKGTKYYSKWSKTSKVTTK